MLDAAGNIYGFTSIGGANNLGSVYELSPPSQSNGQWAETILYDFTRSPCALSPPPGGISNQALAGGLLLDQSTGDLFGAVWPYYDCFDGGLVFQLTPPVAAGAAWNPVILYRFPPVSYLAGCAPPAGPPNGPDAPMSAPVYVKGSLFGTLYEPGGVYQLTPPAVAGGMWSAAQIYSSALPDDWIPSPTSIDGELFGVANPDVTTAGTIFVLAQDAGQTWTYSNIYDFKGPPNDGAFPFTSLIVAPRDFEVTATVPDTTVIAPRSVTVYGATDLGGTSNNGTVFTANIPLPENYHVVATCGVGCLDGSHDFAQCGIGCVLKDVWPVRPVASNPWYDGEVQSVTGDGTVVQFLAQPIVGLLGRPDPPRLPVRVKFSSRGDFVPGQRWLLVPRGPMTGLPPSLSLLRAMRIDPARQMR